MIRNAVSVCVLKTECSHDSNFVVIVDTQIGITATCSAHDDDKNDIMIVWIDVNCLPILFQVDVIRAIIASDVFRLSFLEPKMDYC